MNVAFTEKPFHALTLLELHEVLRLREEVFVVGQKITSEAEIDGKDPACLHVMGHDERASLVATARLFFGEDPVKVGRIAVHPGLQHRGVGTLLMEHVHRLLGDRSAWMSAQAHLRPWYERLGWKVEGGLYDEAGIPHLKMTR